MIRIWQLLIILMAACVSGPALAVDDCNGSISKHAPPGDWSNLLPFVSQYFRSDQHVQFVGSLQLGEWLIVQATAPEHPDDPPFIFFRGRPGRTRVVWEWEGVGPGADEAAKAAIPEIPTKLADCFQWAVGNPY